MKGNTFILKYFLQFACTNLDGSQKEGSTQKGEGVPSEKGGTNPAENYVIALLTKKKQLRMNRKMMTLTFFELYAVYIKN